MTRLLGSNWLLRSEGLVLIEVMMAMVLLAMLIVPLVSAVQSVAGTADRIRSRSASSFGPINSPSACEAWKWGEEVSTAWWRPGPVLRIRAESGSDEDRVVGLWADGWFLGEWEPSEDGDVQAGVPAWTDFTDDELVVRVRRVGGGWGPPWRLVVPAGDGEILLSEVAGEGEAGETVAHVPALGNPALGLSWADAVPEAMPPGLPFLLPDPGPGTWEIGLDGRKQSWKTESNRGLDTYF
jgi:hypothetical protein